MAKRVIDSVPCKSVYSFRSLVVGNEYYLRLRKANVDIFEKVRLVEIPKNFTSVLKMEKTDKFTFQKEDGGHYDCFNDFDKSNGLHVAIPPYIYIVSVWEKE